MSKYAFSVQIKGGFDAAIEQVTAALQKEGFGVLTDIDVQATMKKKLNIHRWPIRRSPPIRILVCCCPVMWWYVKRRMVVLPWPLWTRRQCWG
jgi:uncharacterized protein (DUF302 family)